MNRFEVHAHTHYSNLRLLDCINRPKDLIKRAIELGLSGISITDHECLSSHMEVNLYAKEIQKEKCRGDCGTERSRTCDRQNFDGQRVFPQV